MLHNYPQPGSVVQPFHVLLPGASPRRHCAGGGEPKHAHTNPYYSLQALVHPMPPTVSYRTSSLSVAKQPAWWRAAYRGGLNHLPIHHSKDGDSSRARAILDAHEQQHDCRSPTSHPSIPRSSTASPLFSLHSIMAHLIVDVHLSRAATHNMICSVSRSAHRLALGPLPLQPGTDDNEPVRTQSGIGPRNTALASGPGPSTIGCISHCLRSG
ncbi:hypothetical protein V8F20_004629 [Naviculisporaceae sp. PSN 640]